MSEALLASSAPPSSSPRYLTLGSLRDQITYPLSDSEVAASGRSDADITAVLEAAYLQVGS